VQPEAGQTGHDARVSRLAASCFVVALATMACGNDIEVAPERAALPARVRLLTDAQYAKAVHDLLGDIVLPAVHTPGTEPRQFLHEDVFAVDAPLLVQYRIAAEAVADQIAAREPCQADCSGQVFDFAARAFRRPLVDTEREALWASFERGGFALVVETVLQAPSFLYRSELGTPELTPYELAGELGFTFLDSIPDDELWEAAGDGSLADPGVLAAQVERLLEMPRVREHLTDMVVDWLDVSHVFWAGKDAARFPEMSLELRESMYGESRQFIADVLWKRGGSLRELLTSRETFVDGNLAELYGVELGGDGAFEPVTLEATTRGGILTHASVLTQLGTYYGESIIARGMYVHRKLLCTPEPGRPPFAIIAMESAFSAGFSESQHAHYRAEHVYCSGCHATIDPPGRALHHYDAIGRWRATDAIGAEVESDAWIELGDTRHHVADAVELGRVLADSDHVARCVIDQFAHRVFGRALAEPALQGYLVRRFERTDRDLVDVLRALATSPAFRTRGAP
jgi:hypothetical protein